MKTGYNISSFLKLTHANKILLIVDKPQFQIFDGYKLKKCQIDTALWASLMAQMVKNLLAGQETWV